MDKNIYSVFFEECVISPLDYTPRGIFFSFFSFFALCKRFTIFNIYKNKHMVLTMVH